MSNSKNRDGFETKILQLIIRSFGTVNVGTCLGPRCIPSVIQDVSGSVGALKDTGGEGTDVDPLEFYMVLVVKRLAGVCGES